MNKIKGLLFIIISLLTGILSNSLWETHQPMFQVFGVFFVIFTIVTFIFGFVVGTTEDMNK